MPEGVTAEELAKHKSFDDAWTCLNGMVYDITHYVPKHPGGDVIKSAFGRDGTKLFNKHHPWVNFDFILRDCSVGPIKHPDHTKNYLDPKAP
jgi:cytochrome b involved in lipid metabolism